MAYPDNSKPFTLTTDASGTALGFVLGQFDENGRERVIAFGGRSLNKFDRNYSISERECLAIIEGIKTYHVYLATGLLLFSLIIQLLSGYNQSNTTQVV